MRRSTPWLAGAAAAALLTTAMPGAAGAATAWTIQPVPLPAGASGGQLTAAA
jgi:hypothetical protein